MPTVVGVVGPHDLVDSVATVCEEQPGVVVHRLPYQHESRARDVTAAHAAEVDAWLFTGIVPYALSRDGLTRPAGYVDYSGATLLQALVRLLRAGHDVTRVSVDTLDTAQVHSTFADAGVPVDRVATLPYRQGPAGAGGFAAFHRRHAARVAGAVAITCVSSVYDELAGELTVFRLAPSAQSVRTALRQLLLLATSQVQEDAQIALGLVELDPPGQLDDLAHEVRALGGSLSRKADSTWLIVTTRGPLSEATHGFTALPLLHGLDGESGTVRVGFGLGRGAAEAERLARRALARARSHGSLAAVVSMRNDLDILLEASADAGPPYGSRPEHGPAVLASRAGLSVATVDRLREIAAAAPERLLTTRDVADGLGVQPRTARRMLQRLEMAGVAERAGTTESRAGSDSGAGTGRPLTVYRIAL